MQYVVMAIVGLVVGAIARFILPGAQHMGWILTIVLGIAGSYLAGLIGSLVHGKTDAGGFHPAGFFYSVLGALLLLFVVHNLLHLV